MNTLLSIEELREGLTRAREEGETIDAALENKELEAETVADLKSKFDANTAEIERMAESITRKEQMQKALKGVPGRSEEKTTSSSGVRIGNEPLTYRQNGPHSFFKDVLHATKEGDPGATARLTRHTHEMEVEKYALTTGSGSGVGFVAPQYLQELWANYARAGRPLADAIGPRQLPAAGTSFNVPRITTGAAAGVQASEAGTVSDGTPVTDDVTLPISTVAGKVDMSRQAFDRSDPALDAVLGQDLIASYNQLVDSEIINGPGSGGRVKGILAATGINAVTFTTPVTVAGLYPKVADAVQRIDTLRYMSADLIVMHPRRWAWMLAALDTTSRPLIDAYAPMNPVGDFGRLAAQGIVGGMQGLPVLKDANIPTLLGASTTEDRIIVTRKEDLLFFESGSPTVRVYEEVLSGTLQVRIMAFGYIAFTAERFPAATSVISGAGLVAPTF